MTLTAEQDSVSPSQVRTTGSLIIAGSGIKGVAHLTTETVSRIKSADTVIFCVADAITEGYIRQLNDDVEDLHVYYGDGKRRNTTYAQMAERTMSFVRAGRSVCLVMYGHPGVFVNPSFACADACREEGFPVEFLAAVSAQDCLFSDLQIDPARDGLQTYEATHFLIRHHPVNVTTPLVLWQIGCVGDHAYDHRGFDGRNLHVLIERLQEQYGPDHEVVIYEAATHPLGRCRIDVLRLSDIAIDDVTAISTMFVPPRHPAAIDPDMLERLRQSTPREVSPR